MRFTSLVAMEDSSSVFSLVKLFVDLEHETKHGRPKEQNLGGNFSEIFFHDGLNCLAKTCRKLS